MQVDFNDGRTICIDKPLEWTSFQVVKKLKYLTRAKKVGHAGTLDPLASGLLIICTGKHTKQIESYQAQTKEYTGVFKLGVITPSYDRETEEEHIKSTDNISVEQIHAAAASFVGEQLQYPPIFSAVKIQGERAYEKARRGEEVKVNPKMVTIESFDVEHVEMPYVHFRIVCGKGTYIRSIARDFGEKLGCGAYMTELRRTRIGAFRVDEAYTIEQFEQFVKALKEA